MTTRGLLAAKVFSASALAGSRQVAITRQPRPVSSCTSAKPMPRSEPVIRATGAAFESLVPAWAVLAVASAAIAPAAMEAAVRSAATVASRRCNVNFMMSVANGG